MKIVVTRQPDHLLATCDGHLDGRTAPELLAALGPALDEVGTIVLDLSQVAFLSSAGLRVLLLLHRQLAARRGRAVLVGLSDSLAETMRITGFLQFFEVHATLAGVKL